MRDSSNNPERIEVDLARLIPVALIAGFAVTYGNCYLPFSGP